MKVNKGSGLPGVVGLQFNHPQAPSSSVGTVKVVPSLWLQLAHGAPQWGPVVGEALSRGRVCAAGTGDRAPPHSCCSEVREAAAFPFSSVFCTRLV